MHNRSQEYDKILSRCLTSNGGAYRHRVTDNVIHLSCLDSLYEHPAVLSIRLRL